MKLSSVVRRIFDWGFCSGGPMGWFLAGVRFAIVVHGAGALDHLVWSLRQGRHWRKVGVVD